MLALGSNFSSNETNIGFIAQEVSESLPRLVSGTSGSVSGMGLNTIGITTYFFFATISSAMVKIE